MVSNLYKHLICRQTCELLFIIFALNIADKVLVTNGDVIAEYVASTDTVLNVDNMTQKNALIDSSNCKPNSSSMIVDSSRVPDVCAVIETKYKLLNNLDGCPRTNHMPTVQIQNNLVWTDKKEVSNCSFADLDFDFANLHLSDVMQKEKCLVSQIINHLSSSLTSNCTINETLHNYKRNKQEESSIVTSNSDTSFDLTRDAGVCYKYKYHKKSNSSCKIKNNPNRDILKLNTPNIRRQYSKYKIQNNSKRKYKDISDKISLTPTRILDNSIISMSPNFNTPSHRKRRNTSKTLLTPSYICNDSIVSKSPNFTPVCTKKKNLTKISHVNDYSMKVFKTSPKYKTQIQYPEFNWYKKHVAQSTPRRKKRSIYKFYSGRKRFDRYRYESDVTSDEFTSNNILKPVDLDKTIFFKTAEDIQYGILDTSSEFSSSNFKKSSKIKRRNQYNHLTIKLDKGRYNENDVTDNSNANLLDASSSFNQIEKENKSDNNLSNNKKYIKSENNEVNTRFITVRKNIFNIEILEKSIDTNNIKSTYTTESNSLHKENLIDCVDCDTKKLLNEDLNMNISKTCNLHAKNWYSGRSLFLLHKSSENDSLPAANLPIQCEKQIYLSDSQILCSSRSTDSKKIKNLLEIKDLNMHKAEDNS